jgi:hypothetical protein
MSEENVKEEKATKKLTPVGLDIGTMNLVCAKEEKSNIAIDSLRNVFIEIDPEALGNLDIREINHCSIDDKMYILSEDAYDFGNTLKVPLQRPMRNGAISNKDHDSIEVITAMMKQLVGESKNNSPLCYSVPAKPIDNPNVNVLYHQKLFEQILTKLGWNAFPISEGCAVVFSECEDTKFSGIGFSFGSGMVNVDVVFKGVSTASFSVTRSGDWIDTNVSACFEDLIPNRVTRLKENEKFNLLGEFSYEKKKERVRILESLQFHYEALINYVAKNLVNQLNKIDIDFPDEIPIIISGGTSKVKGFDETFASILESYEFPFDIKEIRSAENKMTAVAEGCLIRAMREV